MKRTASITTVLVAAVLVAGGGYTALATGGTGRHGGGPEDRPSAAAPATASPSASAAPTAAQASAAALRAYPGTVVGVERDENHPGHWEVHLLGTDHVRREVRVDMRTGTVVLDRHGEGRLGSGRLDDDGQGEDRHGEGRLEDGRHREGRLGDDRHGDGHRGGDDHGGRSARDADRSHSGRDDRGEDHTAAPR
ncbi:PepSY domain-containing protein [Streptomyces aureus]